MDRTIKEPLMRTRRKFDRTFKLEAVRNWQASGKTAAVVAQELGLSQALLFSWRRLLPPGEVGGKASTHGSQSGSPSVQAQLEAAQREIRHLREQRDILKKTLGILSEPPSSVSNGFMH
jgi:transposase-like protein